MALLSPRTRTACTVTWKAFSVPVLCLSLASPVFAIPDWRKDGRLGYTTRAQAIMIAEAFVAKGAPREGKAYVIFRDPDGGFTPVFHDKLAKDRPGV